MEVELKENSPGHVENGDPPIPAKQSTISFNTSPPEIRRISTPRESFDQEHGRSREDDLGKTSPTGSKSFISILSSIFPSGTTYHHWVVFWLTYIGYTLFHSTRKTLSAVMANMVSTWLPENSTNPAVDYDSEIWNSNHLFYHLPEAQNFLGVLDACFMFAYAAGLFICGSLGDRFDLRLVLSFGMCFTALVNFLFGCVMEWTGFYSITLYVILWIVNGFIQGSGLPTSISILGNWFGKGGRGFVLGFWSSCQSVGNILGAYIAAAVLPFGYEFPFLVNASMLFAAGLIVFFVLVPAPRDIGLPDSSEKLPSANSKQTDTANGHSVISERPKPVPFFKALLLPGVIAYALAYACLKLVHYSIFFWLPYYLHNNFGWSGSVAASLSSYYDWGGIVGGILGGLISDALGKLTPVVSVQLLAAVAAFGAYSSSPSNRTVNGLLMGLVGFFVGGATNLITTAVSADLGKQDAIRNSAEALSTVTGIIDGTGSTGAALGQIFIPLLQHWLGWKSIFYMFMILLFVAFLCISRLCYREIKEISQSIKSRLRARSTAQPQ